MDQYRHGLILGLGASGLGAARLLMSEGTAVTVLDRDDTPEVAAAARALEANGACVRLGVGRLPSDPFDVCVVSPGIPLTNPWLQECGARGIAVMSEFELGWTRCRGTVLAITGSNGKSTAVKWCWEALRRVGRNARIAGNYGWSLCDAVLESREADPWVVEVSSFQLQTVRSFRPDVGLLLNLHPNHLDRHGTMEAYLGAKSRMFMNVRKEDACIVPRGLLAGLKAAAGGRGRWVTFGTPADADYRYTRGQVVCRGETVASLDGTPYDNDVMGPQAAGVVAALAACGVAGPAAAEAARRMGRLPHRMQAVARFGGVAFVDDSKGTNLTAMQAAVRMTAGPVRLIAGGLAKETDFGSVKEVLAQHAASIYLIGQSAEEMASAWSGAVPCVRCGTLEAAVRRAWADAREGDTILLSPGCASFDQFRNFEERGDRFAEIVKALAEGSSKCNRECPGMVS